MINRLVIILNRETIRHQPWDVEGGGEGDTREIEAVVEMVWR